MMDINKIYHGDSLAVLKTLPDASIDCCVTSPPYWGLRDYGCEGQIGLEESPEAYVSRLVGVFHEVKRALKPTGTLWLNLGDSYASNTKETGRHDKDRSHNGEPRGTYEADPGTLTKIKLNTGVKAKDLIGIPWRVAFALQSDGWYLRSDIIWSKPNPMPESVTDRPTKAHEYVFLLAKSSKYYYDHEAIKEACISTKPAGNKDQVIKGRIGTSIWRPKAENSIPEDGRNKRSVWDIATKPYPEAHFATYPEELIEPCIKAGCPMDGIVLDPFMGSGTTGAVALRLKRNFVGIELNPAYIKLAEKRIWSGSKTLDAFTGEA